MQGTHACTICNAANTLLSTLLLLLDRVIRRRHCRRGLRSTRATAAPQPRRPDPTRPGAMDSDHADYGQPPIRDASSSSPVADDGAAFEEEEEEKDGAMLTEIRWYDARVDLDYEYDAPRWFDLQRDEAPVETAAADLWLDTAPSYPRPRARWFDLPRDEAPVETAAAPSYHPPRARWFDLARDEAPVETAAAPSYPLPRARWFEKSGANGNSSMESTLVKPTASQLARQHKQLEVKNALRSDRSGKRQKLEKGHPNKVVATDQHELIHKARGKNVMSSSYDRATVLPQSNITVPREPKLATRLGAKRSGILRTVPSNSKQFNRRDLQPTCTTQSALTRKSKASASSGASSAEPSSTPVTSQAPPLAQLQDPQPQVLSTTTSQPERLPTETHSSTVDLAASDLLSESNMVNQIMEMGGGSWDRYKVQRALRAAYNNPERAIDYLYSGIPVAAEVAVPVFGQGANTINAPPGETGLSGIPNTTPFDLFPQGASHAGGAGGGGSLDFLRNNQQFQALREMIHANPQILEPMLQELGKQNPQLRRLIEENNDEFRELLNEKCDGDFLDQADQDEMHHAISVTPEELEAIGRLEAMGFERACVIEAFFACDRNEQLCANYLLEHAGDEE